jgi:hypothetical protein
MTGSSPLCLNANDFEPTSQTLNNASIDTMNAAKAQPIRKEELYRIADLGALSWLIDPNH